MTKLDISLADVLAAWQEQGWLRPLDRSLAVLLLRQGASDLEALMAALVSHQIGRGHTCLSLVALAADPQRTLDIPSAQWEARSAHLMHNSELFENLLKPDELLRSLLAESDLTQLPERWLEHAQQGQTCAWQAEQKATGLQPLVYEQHTQLLFLRRYWSYEQRINHWLYERMQRSAEHIDAATITAIVERLIPDVTEHPSWQRVACANTAQQSFSVITGGPGTGKTYTVLRVLATLSELHRVTAPERTLRIALAAPTGKAAARMQESISQSLQETQSDEFNQLQTILPAKASTLHRLLGSQRNSRYFRHHQGMPL
ncbi:MAG: AAA family ATPase, partial [Gammaproteobacteria bacterium]|nr:AAA family ATPase [Gammaproteobacteria bacterium]